LPAIPALQLPRAFTPSARRGLVRRDPALGPLMRALGPFALELRPAPSPFAALARAITFQQLHGTAARTIFGRVQERVGAGRAFTPAALLAVPDAELRAAGLSGAKTAAMKDLALKTQEGVVPSMARARALSDEALIERLIQVRGVGQWTVEMLLIFTLGRPDVLPVDDFAIRKGFMLWQGLPEMPRSRDVLAHGERWRPFRSVASWYLWRSLDAPPQAVATVPAAGRPTGTSRARKASESPAPSRKRSA